MMDVYFSLLHTRAIRRLLRTGPHLLARTAEALTSRCEQITCVDVCCLRYCTSSCRANQTSPGGPSEGVDSQRVCLQHSSILTPSDHIAVRLG
ncbi:unnamed protein product [Boreogadus saida]